MPPTEAAAGRRRARLAMLPIVAAGLMLAACATTRVQAIVDPAFEHTRYDHFIVYAAFTDLGIEAAFERALCAHLRAAGLACTALIDAAPPTREQDAASRHAATRAGGADATLVIELADAAAASRRRLAAPGPAYQIRVIDNASQTVVARLPAHTAGTGQTTARLAASLGRAVVAALDHSALIEE